MMIQRAVLLPPPGPSSSRANGKLAELAVRTQRKKGKRRKKKSRMFITGKNASRLKQRCFLKLLPQLLIANNLELRGKNSEEITRSFLSKAFFLFFTHTECSVFFRLKSVAAYHCIFGENSFNSEIEFTCLSLIILVLLFALQDNFNVFQEKLFAVLKFYLWAKKVQIYEIC